MKARGGYLKESEARLLLR
jgi:serine/threonine protein kinase